MQRLFTAIKAGIGILIIIYLSGCPLQVNAQTKLLKKGKNLVQNAHFVKGVSVLEQFLKANPEHPEALYYAGIGHLKLGDSKRSLSYIEKSLQKNKSEVRPEQAFWYGLALKNNYQYNKAKEQLRKFRSTLDAKDARQAEVEQHLKQIDYVEEYLKKKPGYYVEGLGKTINTEYAEHSPLISSNGSILIYTSRNPKSKGKEAGDNGEHYEDIFVSEINKNDDWTSPKSLSASLNTSKHEASVQLFDNDHKMLIYKYVRGGDIYITEKESDSWSEPKPLDKKNINTKYYESHGYITPDGKTIYFTSARGSKDKDLDIYQSALAENGKWSKPVKLGAEINTEFDEDAPFVSPDGKTLYFSSKGHESIGGYDVFKSTWDEQAQKWGKAEHISMPVNTPYDDMYFVLDPSNNRGYYSSDREGGEGDLDIYEVGKLYTANLEGMVRVEGMEEGFETLSLQFENPQYALKSTANTREKGNYSTTLDSNLPYEVKFFLGGDDEKQLLHTEEVQVPVAKEKDQKVLKNFILPGDVLEKVTLDYNIEGKIVDAETGEGQKGKVTLFDEEGNPVEEVETQEDGSFTMPLTSKVGKNYSLGFENPERQTDRVGTFQTSLAKNIGGEYPVGDNLLVVRGPDGEEVELTQERIYFGFDRSRLDQAALNVLDQLYTVLKNNEWLKVEIVGHTDNTGNAEYNKWLSKKRASQAGEYLKKKGIAEDRIKTAYMGEENPVFDNNTREGRMKNRRVEVNYQKP
ncbi:OmpA family protein [Rapidithrix thailandica]|uniref:OmpA family protein n=1 Tax=Rapidithrix thailandica TaxID=413964 RepID=A0AAW9SDD7_9BACT